MIDNTIIEAAIFSNKFGSNNELIRNKYEKIANLQSYFLRLKGSYSNCNCSGKKVLPNASSYYAPLQSSGYGLDEDCNFVEGGKYTITSEGGKLKKVLFEPETELTPAFESFDI